jgi:hypothetical protein
MKKLARGTAILVIQAALLGIASRAPAAPPALVPAGQVARAVSLHDLVAQENGNFSAVLINDSSQPVRDVELLIVYSFLWKNERHPGDDDPGRSIYSTVREEMRPGEKLSVNFKPSPPLPARSDGRFVTSVSVVGLTQIGP